MFVRVYILIILVLKGHRIYTREKANNSLFIQTFFANNVMQVNMKQTQMTTFFVLKKFKSSETGYALYLNHTDLEKYLDI